MQNDVDKCFVAWQAAADTVRDLEDESAAADAAANVAEDKRQSRHQVTAEHGLKSLSKGFAVTAHVQCLDLMKNR